MRRTILAAVLTAAASLMTPCAAARESADSLETAIAGETLLDAEGLAVVGNMLNRYVAWQNVTFNGRLRADRLPISPSVRIYAERGKLIQISVRVPLMGEVGRIEITPQEVLAVNKWKKNYCRESTESLLEMYPGLLDDIQSLLLGRVVLFGKGELDAALLDDIVLYPAREDEWAVVPREMPAGGKVRYGYVVAGNGRTQALVGKLRDRDDDLRLEYRYDGTEMAMTVTAPLKKGNVCGTLDFSSVKWGGERMNSVGLDRYTRMSVSEFIRNLK